MFEYIIPLWIIIFIVLFIFLLALLLIIFWVWAIIHCLFSKLSAAQKIFWLIIIIFFSLIGALIYFIFSKATGEKKMKTKSFKGKRLFRSKKNRMIAGVCGGIGEYFKIDPTLIRLIWALFSVFSLGTGVIVYIIAWIIIPEEK